MKKKTYIFGVLIFCTLCSSSFKFATEHFQLTLSDVGQVESFVDLRNGINYVDAGDTRFCVLYTEKGGPPLAANHVVQNGNILTFSFLETPVTVKLKVTTEKSYLVFDVVEITGDFYSLQFARVPLTIDYQKDDFAACAMSRKLNTKTLDFPGKSNLLGGQCFSQLGYDGAGVFLLGMPESQLRETMKQVVDTYVPGEMPVNHAGGPYAIDNPKSYGTYTITEQRINESSVDEYVAYLSRFGVDQVDFIQGGAFRQGDFYFDPTAYPNGVSDFRKTSEAFNRHGIITGLHTYSLLLDEHSKYVTPVPHKELDVMHTFTLANDLGTDEQTIQVNESTSDVSEITGWTIRNSKVIRIDDELILFENPSRTPPYGFTSCTRGAFGTVKSAHSKGAPVDHLTQYYWLFAPKIGSELFFEIARETARTYNEGGFGMIYLDALDGTFAFVDDREHAWYYEVLFVNEVLKHVKKPPLLEYSTITPSLWYGRSRIGAEEIPSRAYKHYFDRHSEVNQRRAGLYLPAQMGWLMLEPAYRSMDNKENYQFHVMFQEDTEYLGAKCLAYNYGLSYYIDVRKARPGVYRNADILRRYDSIRRAGHFSAETLQRLRDPQADFLLQQSGDDWYLTEVNYAYTVLRPDIREFSYHNPYKEQSPMIRIEHRHQPVAYDSPEGIDLLSLDESQPVQAVTIREFVEPVDLSGHLGLGLWVYGDGGGQVISVRVESSPHLTSGFTDHIVTVDFTGWRYFALAEADNGSAGDIFPDNHSHPYSFNYARSRDPVYYNSISKVHLLVKGDTENLRFRTIRALPLTADTYLVDPSLTKMNGQKITFRGRIKNGHYMEYTPGGRAVVYDPSGYEISEMLPDGSSFELPAGDATLLFSGVTESGIIPVVRFTLRTSDDQPIAMAEKNESILPSFVASENVLLTFNTETTPDEVEGLLVPTSDYKIYNPYKDVNWATWDQYKASHHTHNKWTDKTVRANNDGQNTTAEMVNRYYAEDYNILAFTAHDYVTHDWDDVKDRDGVLFGTVNSARKVEINAGTAAIAPGTTSLVGRSGATAGMINIPYSCERSFSDHINTFWANFDSDASSGAMEPILEKVVEVGGLAHINHPAYHTSGFDDAVANIMNNKPEIIKKYVDLFAEFSPKYLVGMEISNVSDIDRVLWDNILKQTMPYRNVWGFSNDDAHSNSSVGNSFNMMLMPELTEAATRTSMETGAFYAVARVSRSEDINSPANTVANPTPKITNIVVNEDEGTIAITGTNYTSIDWIADGVKIATGNTLYLGDHTGKINNYVRAQIKSTTGIAYTQPFGITTERDLEEVYSIVIRNDYGKGSSKANVIYTKQGTQITLTATPDRFYRFKEWQVISGDITIVNNMFTMPASNVVVKGIFEIDPDYPDPWVAGNGTINVTAEIDNFAFPPTNQQIAATAIYTNYDGSYTLSSGKYTAKLPEDAVLNGFRAFGILKTDIAGVPLKFGPTANKSYTIKFDWKNLYEGPDNPAGTWRGDVELRAYSVQNGGLMFNANLLMPGSRTGTETGTYSGTFDFSSQHSSATWTISPNDGDDIYLIIWGSEIKGFEVSNFTITDNTYKNAYTVMCRHQPVAYDSPKGIDLLPLEVFE